MKRVRHLLIFATQMCETGGIENHLVRFSEQLSAEGIKMTFLCPNYNLGAGLHARLEAHVDSLIVLKSNGARSSRIGRVFWLIKRAFGLRGMLFDALYLNGQGEAASLLHTILGRGTTRTILHHHSAGDQEEIRTWPSPYRKLMCRVDEVIACSKRNAESLQAEIGHDVKVVYCFTAPSYMVDAKSMEPLHFGFFGRLIPQKGIDTILQLSADSRLKHVRWHLWGALEAYSAEFCDDFPNATYHGIFETNEQLRESLASMHTFTLFSTHNEGLPLVLLEAMSAGVPWIASDRGGISDLLVDEDHTILIPREFSYDDALCASMSMTENLLRGRVFPEKLSQVYRSTYAPEVLVDQWLEILFPQISDVQIDSGASKK